MPPTTRSSPPETYGVPPNKYPLPILPLPRASCHPAPRSHPRRRRRGGGGVSHVLPRPARLARDRVRRRHRGRLPRAPRLRAACLLLLPPPRGRRPGLRRQRRPRPWRLRAARRLLGLQLGPHLHHRAPRRLRGGRRVPGLLLPRRRRHGLSRRARPRRHRVVPEDALLQGRRGRGRRGHLLDLPLRVPGGRDAAGDARVQAQVPPHVPRRVAAPERVLPRLPVLAHPHPRRHPALHSTLGARPAVAVRCRPSPQQVWLIHQ